MRKEQKAQVIDEIAAQLGDAEAVYAVDYRGLSVPQAAELRANLREHDAYFRVVKNTLTLLAADKAGVVEIKELVADGPTALTFVQGDAALAAKVLDTFSRQANVLEVKGGLMGGRTLDADEIRQLARLPAATRSSHSSRAWWRRRSPGLVRGLGSMVSGLAVALGQVRAQKEAESPAEAPAAEAPAEEAPGGGGSGRGAGGRGSTGRGVAEEPPKAAAEPQEPDSDSDSDAEKEAQ